MKELIRHKLQHDFKRIKTSAKWVLFSIVSGLLVGGVGTLFYFGMYVVTLTRTKNPWLIFLLPVSGLLIVGCYRLLHDEKDTGTNLVLSAIHSDEDLPLRMAPLIFISTLITHLFGGSAGREGAALHVMAEVSETVLEKLFRFDEKDKHIMIMCGMSAAFSALFGTPNGCGCLFHGGCQCRCHVLCGTGSVCDFLARCTCSSRIFRCLTGNVSH